MVLPIELSPDLEAKLAAAASRQGSPPAQFAREVLERSLYIEVPPEDPYAGLPKRTPDDLEELARRHRAQPIDLDAMMRADLWPENEDTEEFLTTLRDWRVLPAVAIEAKAPSGSTPEVPGRALLSKLSGVTAR